MPKTKLRNLWPSGLAFLVALGIIATLPINTKMNRLANLDMEDAGFGETYIMYSKSNPAKAYVVDRRDSTVRRSNNKQPGRMWEVYRFPAQSGLPDAEVYLVKSKRKGKGTVFFVPATDVRDWVYPFLYQFVRKHRESLGLPNVEWTNLFVNRIYNGLYLRVSLPFDLRKKDKGSGILREIISVVGNRSAHVDTRFDDAPGIYSDSVEASIFPAVDPPPPTLAWLASRNPYDGVTVLMSNIPPNNVSLLPLPVSLPALFKAKNGRSPAGYEDERFSRWMEWPEEVNFSAPFSEPELHSLHADFELYAQSFRKAVQLTGQFHENIEYYRHELQTRQDSGRNIELNLGQL